MAMEIYIFNNMNLFLYYVKWNRVNVVFLIFPIHTTFEMIITEYHRIITLHVVQILRKITLWLLSLCLIGSITGAIWGVYLMKKTLSGGQVKIAIGLILYHIGVKMIWDLLKSFIIS
jgi:hypothetical protein